MTEAAHQDFFEVRIQVGPVPYTTVHRKESRREGAIKDRWCPRIQITANQRGMLYGVWAVAVCALVVAGDVRPRTSLASESLCARVCNGLVLRRSTPVGARGVCMMPLG